MRAMSPLASPRRSSGTRLFIEIHAHPLFGRGMSMMACASGSSGSGIAPSAPARSLLILSVSRQRQQTFESLARSS